jgi:nitroreductase/NAD-dependent dihydropyrimidine dehydrogenase PreA subunit
MNFPEFDVSNCLADGLCVQACPTDTLRLGENHHPELVPNSTCLACGHCVSVCPAMAIRVGGIEPTRLEPLPADWRLTPERISRFLRGRRSTRVFSQESVDRSTIEQLIATTQYAPSGHNTQPLGWTVFEDRQRIRALAESVVAWMRQCISVQSPYVRALNMPDVLRSWEDGRDPICRDAPILVLAHAPEHLPTSAHAGAIAITYLELAAVSYGLGTCWAGFVFVAAGNSAEVQACLSLPAGRRCAGALLLGRPALEHLRVPARRAPSLEFV